MGAEKALLALPGLKRYKKGLRSRIEQEHFLDHLRKYIAMYQTDSPWEVSTTNRYTITTYEAAVTARRRIKQGDPVKYLTGTLVPLTTEESADLDMTNRNFSIVVSSRKKNSSIFLGPARFANHDCDANGRLVTRGPDGMEVVAVKNIDVGDEITVSYGDDYFGPANMDCLCHTCEMLERNGWTAKSGLAIDSHASTPSVETRPSVVSNPRNLKRKRESDLSSQSSPGHSPSKHLKVTQSPSKLQHSWTPPSSSESEPLPQITALQAPDLVEDVPKILAEDDRALSPPHSPSQVNDLNAPEAAKSAAELLGPADIDVQIVDLIQQPLGGSRAKKSGRESKMAARLLGKMTVRVPISPAPTSPSSHGSMPEVRSSNQVIHPTPTSTKSVTIKIESLETTKVETDGDTIIVASSSRHSSRFSADPSVLEDCGETSSAFPSLIEPPVPHVVSTLSTTTITKEVHQPDVSNIPSLEANVLPSIEAGSTSTTVATLTVHPVNGTIRIAGDYILTRKLLAQPHDRWVQCHNTQCFGFFIQPNGYQTRRECPRCERHSMLYGFPWPKTDPDPRKLLERKSQGAGRKKKEGTSVEYSAFRRTGKSGKGSWVEGGGDDEERTMDHRTIHRFVLPEEERELTRKGLLREAELARAAGDHALAILEARMRAASRGQGTESAARDSESGNDSSTPDEARRRSNRFVTQPVGVYTDRY